MSEKPHAAMLRTVYNAAQFAQEILGGNHSARWVREQCRVRNIKTVGVRPFLIPQAEALRFLGVTTP